MGRAGEEPRLVVPEGLVIDEIVRERLERRLAHAPRALVGIGAEATELPPGGSYRTEAEWRSLELDGPAADVPPDAGGVISVRGAALLRPEVGYALRDGVIRLTEPEGAGLDAGAGCILIDPGSHAHDPLRPIGPLLVASERGRPPFARRPVVLFLACEPTGLADWARLLVNRLVRRDVEARLAMHEVAAGVHLTRPCLPAAESVRALAPDVVVALDGAAASAADQWCEGDRSTVVVGFDPDPDASEELVSWQIGRASGRLRARIGPRVDASSFARLVSRLCAGPQPVPPGRSPAPERIVVRERWRAARTVSCVVVAGPVRGRAAARIEALAEHLAPSNVPASPVPLAQLDAPDVREASVVVLAGVSPTEALSELVSERRQAGLPTVVDLTVDALDLGASAGSVAPPLTPEAKGLATACGAGVSAVPAVCAALEAAGVRSLLLPTLLTPQRIKALRAARTAKQPGSPVVIGWYTGSAGDPEPEYLGAVAEVVAQSLTAGAGARLVLVGSGRRVPVVNPRRVEVVSDADLDAATLAGWWAHVWTPAVIGGEIAVDPVVFEEASYAGVPSVLPAAARRVVDGLIAQQVLVHSLADAERWASALRHLVGDAGRRNARAAEATRRADALDGPASARAVANRFVGWACARAGNGEEHG